MVFAEVHTGFQGRAPWMRPRRRLGATSGAAGAWSAGSSGSLGGAFLATGAFRSQM